MKMLTLSLLHFIGILSIIFGILFTISFYGLFIGLILLPLGTIFIKFADLIHTTIATKIVLYFGYISSSLAYLLFGILIISYSLR